GRAAGRSRGRARRPEGSAGGVTLTGMLPGRGRSRGGARRAPLSRVLTHPPQPPRQLQPDVPASLEAVCLKCLEKAAADRYPSAAALAADLERFLGEPVSNGPASPSGSPARVADQAGQGALPSPRPGSDLRSRKRWQRRIRQPAFLLAAASVGVVASLLIVGALSRPWLFPAGSSCSGGIGPEDDPRVLTVSKNPEDGGQFR